MDHVVVDHWSRRDSILHRRDPRAKIIALLVFLVAVATTNRHLASCSAIYLALLVGGALLARLPILGLFLRAAVILPFVGMFAIICVVAGQMDRGIALLLKSYLSASGALLLVATTPLPSLLRGLEGLAVPRFLLMVAQFLYRYLFVITEEAHQMRVAAESRGGFRRALGFSAAAGAVATLFARSYSRAESIHYAMVARGFEGHIPVLGASRFGSADLLFLAGAILLTAGGRLW